MNYELFENKYVDQIPNNNYMRPIFEDLLKNYSFEEILDCGCGNGIYGKFFKSIKNVKLSGVDGSIYALEKARNEGYDEVLEVKDFSRDRLPYLDGHFDFVVCKDVFEHLVNPLHLLSEIIRVLRNDGYFLLHVPNHFPFKSRIKFVLTLNMDTHGYFKEADEWDYPHLRFFTYKGLIKRMCQEKRMKLVKNYSQKFTSYFPMTAWIKPLRLTQEFLARRNPTLFSEGISLLFQKTESGT